MNGVPVIGSAPGTGSGSRWRDAGGILPYLPPMAGASEDDSPDAQAVLGDAQVIEAGATDASSETDESIDIDVTLIVPPAPASEATETPAEEAAEAGAIAAAIARADAAMARADSAHTRLDELQASIAEPEPEPDAETPPAGQASEGGDSQTPDVPPQREHWLNRKIRLPGSSGN